MERSVEITLRPDDLVESSKLQFRTFVRSRNGIVSFGLGALISSVVFAAFIWDGTTSSVVTAIVFALLAPVIVVAAPAAVVWFATPFTARRVFAQQASLRKPFRMSWDDEAIRTEGEGGHAVIPWRDFFRAERNDTLINLFESQALRRLVPMRVLSPEQRADIERLIAPLLRT